jgi:hypothetical protein
VISGRRCSDYVRTTLHFASWTAKLPTPCSSPMSQYCWIVFETSRIEQRTPRGHSCDGNCSCVPLVKRSRFESRLGFLCHHIFRIAAVAVSANIRAGIDRTLGAPPAWPWAKLIVFKLTDSIAGMRKQRGQKGNPYRLNLRECAAINPFAAAVSTGVLSRHVDQEIRRPQGLLRSARP